MKAYIFIGAGILLLFYVFYYRSHPLISKVRIRNHRIPVDVAVSVYEQARGLGGRAELKENTGMLFLYDHKEQYNFWMLGMKFPLDFVWIDGKKVVDITRNVPPPKGMEKPTIVKPSVPVDKILEINAGDIDKFGIKVGDTVDFLDR